MEEPRLSFLSHALRPLYSPSSLLEHDELPLKATYDRGVQCIAYLEEWIVWAPSYKNCQLAVLQVVGTLRDLGFLINWEKSVIKPSQLLVWP